jgi:hypothetical protein
MKRVAYILSLLLVLVGCGQKKTAAGDPILQSTEDFLKYIETHPPSGASFQLALSDSFTFAGKPDTMGAGSALIVAELFKRGYVPDGTPEKKNGFRILRFKNTQ